MRADAITAAFVGVDSEHVPGIEVREWQQSVEGQRCVFHVSCPALPKLTSRQC